MPAARATRTRTPVRAPQVAAASQHVHARARTPRAQSVMGGQAHGGDGRALFNEAVGATVGVGVCCL